MLQSFCLWEPIKALFADSPSAFLNSFPYASFPGSKKAIPASLAGSSGHDYPILASVT